MPHNLLNNFSHTSNPVRFNAHGKLEYWSQNNLINKTMKWQEIFTSWYASLLMKLMLTLVFSCSLTQHSHKVKKWWTLEEFHTLSQRVKLGDKKNQYSQQRVLDRSLYLMSSLSCDLYISFPSSTSGHALKQCIVLNPNFGDQSSLYPQF